MNSIEKALLKKQAELAKSNSQKSPSENQEFVEKASTIDKAPKQVTSQETDYNKEQFFQLNLAELEAKGFVSNSTNRKLINEEFRAIKRKVLDNAFGPLSNSLNNSNIIMITSSRPGEGKTFTAVNLALSIALEKDKTVLLVDADVLKPNVMRTLGLKSEEGLMEYLLGEKSDISEIMNNTNVPNLRIIPAGKSHHLSTELLASEKMSQAVEEFANRYPDRVVIIDTPPLLGINETAILANLAGQAIIVTEENKSKLMDIQRAVNHLNPEMAIGFVVNKAQGSNHDGAGYGYGYGYGYGVN